MFASSEGYLDHLIYFCFIFSHISQPKEAQRESLPYFYSFEAHSETQMIVDGDGDECRSQILECHGKFYVCPWNKVGINRCTQKNTEETFSSLTGRYNDTDL